MSSDPAGPPAPIAATLSISTLAATCTFDQPLIAGALAPINWTMFVNLGAGTRILPAGGSVVASGSTVSWNALNFGPSPLPRGLDYTAATPPRARSLATGLDAPAFTQFVITLLP